MNESKQKSKVDSRLQRIANVLLLNASFIDNLALLNGKMGIAIFFYQYARYTGSKIFGDYAGELSFNIKKFSNTILSIIRDDQMAKRLAIKAYKNLNIKFSASLMAKKRTIFFIL